MDTTSSTCSFATAESVAEPAVPLTTTTTMTTMVPTTAVGLTPTLASNGMDFFFTEAPDQLLGATELDVQLSPLLQDRIAQLCLVKMRQASSGRESLQRLARLSCFWRRLQAEVLLMPMFTAPQVPAPIDQWLAEFAALEPVSSSTTASTTPTGSQQQHQQQGSTSEISWSLDLLGPPPTGSGLGLEFDLWNMDSLPQELASMGGLSLPFTVHTTTPTTSTSTTSAITAPVANPFHDITSMTSIASSGIPQMDEAVQEPLATMDSMHDHRYDHNGSMSSSEQVSTYSMDSDTSSSLQPFSTSSAVDVATSPVNVVQEISRDVSNVVSQSLEDVPELTTTASATATAAVVSRVEQQHTAAIIDVVIDKTESDMDVDLPLEGMALTSPPPSPSKRRTAANKLAGGNGNATNGSSSNDQRRTRKSTRLATKTSRKRSNSTSAGTSSSSRRPPASFSSRLATLMQQQQQQQQVEHDQSEHDHDHDDESYPLHRHHRLLGDDLEHNSRIKRRRGSADSSSGSDSSPESSPSSPKTPPSNYEGPSAAPANAAEMGCNSQTLYIMDAKSSSASARSGGATGRGHGRAIKGSVSTDTAACQEQPLGGKVLQHHHHHHHHSPAVVVAVEDIVNLKRMEDDGDIEMQSTLPITQFPTARRPSTRAFGRS
ncbi:hypothetical protein BGZ99_005456 [Dissophora globulifera]|uniref:Uncharacterized protein n=1 Tax=Dissophora globulifera TaxID=979702 RepID=A0A9P6RHG6_9FUNG|nr:hypothetical protein BGZ99_005456 [Dissophora globulifera]